MLAGMPTQSGKLWAFREIETEPAPGITALTNTPKEVLRIVSQTAHALANENVRLKAELSACKDHYSNVTAHMAQRLDGANAEIQRMDGERKEHEARMASIMAKMAHFASDRLHMEAQLAAATAQAKLDVDHLAARVDGLREQSAALETAQEQLRAVLLSRDDEIVRLQWDSTYMQETAARMRQECNLLCCEMRSEEISASKRAEADRMRILAVVANGVREPPCHPFEAASHCAATTL